jgi:hypothetical protein
MNFLEALRHVVEGVRVTVSLAYAVRELARALREEDEEEAARVVQERMRERAAGKARKRTEEARAKQKGM